MRVCRLATAMPYTYEHIFIDNASTDRTVEILRGSARQDKRVKVIVNTRNFGHIRSPFHGLLQATGDAVISIVADLQDPPEMIREFVANGRGLQGRRRREEGEPRESRPCSSSAACTTGSSAASATCR